MLWNDILLHSSSSVGNIWEKKKKQKIVPEERNTCTTVQCTVPFFEDETAATKITQ